MAINLQISTQEAQDQLRALDAALDGIASKFESTSGQIDAAMGKVSQATASAKPVDPQVAESIKRVGDEAEKAGQKAPSVGLLSRALGALSSVSLGGITSSLGGLSGALARVTPASVYSIGSVFTSAFGTAAAAVGSAAASIGGSVATMIGSLVGGGGAGGGGGGGLMGAVMAATRAVGPLVAAYIGIQSIKAAVTTIAQATVTMEKFEATVRAVSGSQEVARTEWEFVRKVAMETATDITAAAESYRKFSLAALQSGISLKETHSMFEKLSAVFRVFQLDAQGTRLSFLAFEQMLNKGKVSMEELRRQLGEHLPGAMGSMAKALHVSVSELDQMVKKGQLGTDAVRKMVDQLYTDFGSRLPEALKTGLGQFTLLFNNMTILAGEFGKGVDSFLVPALQRFNATLQDPAMSQFMTVLGQIVGLIVGGVVEALNVAAVAINYFISGISTLIGWISTGISYVTAFAQVIGGDIVSGVEAAVNAVSALWTEIGGASAVSAIVQFLADTWDRLGVVINYVLNSTPVQAILEGWRNTIDWVSAGIQAMIDWFMQIPGVSAVLNYLSSVFDRVQQRVADNAATAAKASSDYDKLGASMNNAAAAGEKLAKVPAFKPVKPLDFSKDLAKDNAAEAAAAKKPDWLKALGDQLNALAADQNLSDPTRGIKSADQLTRELGVSSETMRQFEQTLDRSTTQLSQDLGGMTAAVDNVGTGLTAAVDGIGAGVAELSASVDGVGVALDGVTAPLIGLPSALEGLDASMFEVAGNIDTLAANDDILSADLAATSSWLNALNTTTYPDLIDQTGNLESAVHNNTDWLEANTSAIADNTAATDALSAGTDALTGAIDSMDSSGNSSGGNSGSASVSDLGGSSSNGSDQTDTANFRYGGLTNSPTRFGSAPLSAFSKAPHFADGGIPSILHPNEAVVPLAGGAIPVSFSAGGGGALAAPLLRGILDNVKLIHQDLKETEVLNNNNATLAHNDAEKAYNVLIMLQQIGTQALTFLGNLKASFDAMTSKFDALSSSIDRAINELSSKIEGATSSGGASSGASSGATRSVRGRAVGANTTQDNGWIGGAGPLPSMESLLQFLPTPAGGGDAMLGGSFGGTNAYGLGPDFWKAYEKFYLAGPKKVGAADGSPNIYKEATGRSADVTIHPDEAVVPLLDGRAVPVRLPDAVMERLTHSGVSGAGKQIVVQVTMNVATPNPAAFKASEDQMLRSMEAKLRRVVTQYGSDRPVDDPTTRSN